MLSLVERCAFFAHYGAAVVAMRVGRTSFAGKRFESALELCERHVPALSSLAFLHLNEGRYVDAVGLYHRLCSLTPQSSTAHFGLANALQQLDRHIEAVNEFNIAMALDPENRVIQYNLARSFIAIGRKQDALTLYTRLAHADPEDGEAVGNLGATLSELGHWSEALQYHERAVSLTPNAVHAYNLALTLYQLDRFEDAERAFHRALHMDQDSIEIIVRLAMSISEQGRYDEALALLKKGASKEPTNSAVLSSLVATLLMAGDINEAIRTATDFVNRNPKSAAGHEVLGFIHLKSRNGEAALTCYQQAISLEPENTELHAGRAAALSLLERHSEALAAFEIVQRANPEYLETHPDFAEHRAVSRAAVGPKSIH